MHHGQDSAARWYLALASLVDTLFLRILPMVVVVYDVLLVEHEIVASGAPDGTFVGVAAVDTVVVVAAVGQVATVVGANVHVALEEVVHIVADVAEEEVSRLAAVVLHRFELASLRTRMFSNI